MEFLVDSNIQSVIKSANDARLTVIGAGEPLVHQCETEIVIGKVKM
jgi:hypothetical protein